MKKTRFFGCEIRGSFIGAVLSVIFTSLAISQSLDVDSPDFRNPYPNVDLFGQLNLVADLGALDGGNNLYLPVQFVFSSAPGIRSRFLGSGWTFPLLESRVERLSESAIRVVLPSGQLMVLLRRIDDSTSYQTWSGVWRGKMEDTHNFTLSRADGYQMKFVNGRISSLKTELGQTLNWKSGSKGSSEIRDARGSLVLSLSPKDAQDHSRSLMINGNEFNLSFDKRPMVQEVESHRFLGRLEESLHEIKKSSAVVQTYSYAVLDDLTPSITRKVPASGGERVFSWNPKSGAILSAGKWIYTVLPTGRADAPFPKISRSNDQQETESVFSDFYGGKYTETDAKGTINEVTMFTTGLAQGKIRSIDETKDGKKTKIYTAQYDEKGRLLRALSEAGEELYSYDKDGKISSYQGISLFTGKVDEMPKSVKDTMSLAQKWRAAHPEFIATSQVDSAVSKRNSTYFMKPSLWRSVSEFSIPFSYTVANQPGTNGVLQYFPSANIVTPMPNDGLIKLPQRTIWDVALLEKELEKKAYSIGSASDESGTKIILATNDAVPAVAIYHLDKEGRFDQMSFREQMGRPMVSQSFSYPRLDPATLDKELNKILSAPTVRKDITPRDALDLVISGGN